MADGRILVVDDEESIRFTFDSFLGEEGYEVCGVETGREALDLVGREGNVQVLSRGLDLPECIGVVQGV